jgi:hypothetical protein
MHISNFLWSTLLLLTPTLSSSFTYNNSTFLLNGNPYQIIGGQMDPQRIPREYWRHRLSMARAMGLNTIFSYIFWNRFEPRPGEWDFSGPNDVATYFRLAQEEGLHVVLRPGPYICGEHEWGGFPAWLSQIPGMGVRQDNEPFLNAAEAYFARIARELAPLQITQGGPILMAQLENEYGSFGTDHTYIAKMRDLMKSYFDVFLYTNDGGAGHYLLGGQISGVLAEIDGEPQVGFAARNQYVTDASSLGPLLDGEYYVTWLDTWASNSSYQTDAENPASTQQALDDIDWVLSHNDSISLYMFHGGTNWGFDNGALWSSDGYLQPVTSSYDYGAPLDESGRPREIYHQIREVISKYVPEGSIPEVPESVNLSDIPSFPLQPVGTLLDGMVPTAISPSPIPMDALNQSYGFVLYEHVVVESSVSGQILPGDKPRDRVMVFVNGGRVGVIDNIYTTPAKVDLRLKKGDILQLLVENQGRVDYGPPLVDQVKGIVGNVTVGGTVLTNWAMYSLQLDELPPFSDPAAVAMATTALPATMDNKLPPIFYKGLFHVNNNSGASSSSDSTSSLLSHDTFLSLPAGIKGIIWVNGYNLGRYWIIGPQQSLYVPGTILLENLPNEIVVLELEPKVESLWDFTAYGSAVREWGNFPDPDAP